MPLFQLTLGYPEEGTEKSEDNLTVPIMVPYLFYQKQIVCTEEGLFTAAQQGIIKT